MLEFFDIRWQNFRSFADTGWIKVKPITVVVGSNNSGKTSLHAPLLLMKQTIESGDPSAALVTSGDLVDVGSFVDAVHCHRESHKIGLSVKWDHALNPNRKKASLGSDRPGSAHWEFMSEDGSSAVALAETTILDIFDRPLLTRRRTKSGNYSIAKFPEKLKANTSSPVEQAMIEAVKDAQPSGFLFSEDEVRQAGFIAQAQARMEDNAGNGEFYKLPASTGLTMYRATVGYASSAFESFLNEIYYVGPIRERLRRFYEVSSARPRSVGTRGEDAPQLIFRWGNDTERMEKLDSWLSRFGFSQDLKIVKQGEYAFSLLLKGADSSPPMGFVDLGFGLSQILPLIVQGLNASPGDMVIAEQPEIHLNPALQATLADLFVQFANEQGLWSYIETHSEHLLLRLRRLVAEGMINPDMVALYYVERTGQESEVRHIPIGADGSIAPDTWPEGFFGESLRDAVGLAEAQMRLEG